jgi:AraC family transcriptional regulator of adaptative response/methylated-DNA-[protein]-cysteine methyltransferase
MPRTRGRTFEPMSDIIHLEDYEATRDWNRMARAIRFLTERYTEQPSLDDAAKAVGLSPFHFQRVFARYVGVSPKSFVGHLTLEHAKGELARGSSVLEASLDAGLSGPSRLHDLSLKIEAMTPGDYAKGGSGLEVRHGVVDCPFGRAIVMETDKGVCGLGFGDDGEDDAMFEDMRARWPKARFIDDVARADATAKRIFVSKDPVGLHLLGTPFQIKVWQALLTIPEGRMTTYGTLAARLGDEKASRAVGTAVGRNPISWLVPCHRVLGKTAALTGYHWGLVRKRSMLAVEAARAEARFAKTSASA